MFCHHSGQFLSIYLHHEHNIHQSIHTLSSTYLRWCCRNKHSDSSPHRPTFQEYSGGPKASPDQNALISRSALSILLVRSTQKTSSIRKHHGQVPHPPQRSSCNMEKKQLYRKLLPANRANQLLSKAESHRPVDEEPDYINTPSYQRRISYDC